MTFAELSGNCLDMLGYLRVAFPAPSLQFHLLTLLRFFSKPWQAFSQQQHSGFLWLRLRPNRLHLALGSRLLFDHLCDELIKIALHYEITLALAHVLPGMAWHGQMVNPAWAAVWPQVARCGRNTNYIHQAVTTEPEPEDAAASST